MSELVVVVDEEMADGFRLAGVRVITVAEGQAAQKEIDELIADENVGIIALADDYLEDLKEETREFFDTSTRPVLVPIPTKIKLEEEGTSEDYVARLVQRAIGFRVELKRE